MSTYYLNADTGNDSTGSGTALSPWLTISKAHTSATSGDTIICTDSTAEYTFTNQTFTKNLNIYGEQDDASGAVFNGAAAAVKWYTNKTPSIVQDIKRITFKNITTPGPGQYINIICGYQLTVSNCIFKDIIQTATAGGGGPSGIVGAEYKSGISDNAITVENCLFYNLTGGTPSITINLHNGGGADTGYEHWYNNTVYSDGTYTTPNMFSMNAVSTMDVILKNNIFYCTTSVALNSSTGITSFTNNSTYNMTSVPSGTNNITSDPLFVDGVNANFNLRPTSPCIDTGVLL